MYHKGMDITFDYIWEELSVVIGLMLNNSYTSNVIDYFRVVLCCIGCDDDCLDSYIVVDLLQTITISTCYVVGISGSNSSDCGLNEIRGCCKNIQFGFALDEFNNNRTYVKVCNGGSSEGCILVNKYNHSVISAFNEKPVVKGNCLCNNNLFVVFEGMLEITSITVCKDTNNQSHSIVYVNDTL